MAVVRARGDELDVVALDVEDGDVRWRQPFRGMPDHRSTWMGELVHRADSGEEYVVFQPAGTGARLSDEAPAPYVAVDPVSGRVVARTKPVRAGYPARSCRDDRDVCLTLGADNHFGRPITRWDLDRFVLEVEPPIVPARVSSIGDDGLYSAISRSDMSFPFVGRWSEEGGVWQRRVDSLAGKRWQATVGTAFGHVDGSNLLLVGLGYRHRFERLDRRYAKGEPVALDMSLRRIVGVDGQTGEVLWNRRGADFDCLELAEPDLAVRCAMSGQVVFREDWSSPRGRSLRLHVEGFDPRTGETTWRLEIDPEVALDVYLGETSVDDLDGIVDGAELRLVPTRRGPQLLSLVDGSHRRIAASSVMLCRESVEYPYAMDRPDSLILRDRSVLTGCTTRGRATSLPPSAFGLLTGATDAGEGRYLVDARDRLVAYGLAESV